MRRLLTLVVLLACNSASAGMVVAETGRTNGSATESVVMGIQSWFHAILSLLG